VTGSASRLCYRPGLDQWGSAISVDRGGPLSLFAILAVYPNFLGSVETNVVVRLCRANQALDVLAWERNGFPFQASAERQISFWLTGIRWLRA